MGREWKTRYKLLGKSGLRVSELALGTMTFGEAWGWGAAPEECPRMFDRYAEAGSNFIDTRLIHNAVIDPPHFSVRYCLKQNSITSIKLIARCGAMPT